MLDPVYGAALAASSRDALRRVAGDRRTGLALALRPVRGGDTDPFNPRLNAIGLRLYRSF